MYDCKTNMIINMSLSFIIGHFHSKIISDYNIRICNNNVNTIIKKQVLNTLI